MSHADIATRAVSAEGATGRCPFHSLSPETFDEWLERGLQCSAGRREFKLGRYFVARFRTGADFAEAMEQFKREVAEYRKTGFLALFVHDEARCQTAEDELWMLGEAIRQAGMTDNVPSLISGETLATPIDVICPVTGEETAYEFFSVAFCRNAANPADKLYDPSLSAPFTAINTTSDAFAFATLVRDQAIRAWGIPPHQQTDRAAVEMLFRKCVTVWQNMSINTIQSYSRVAVDPSRGVHLSEDRKRWLAAHNDPVFAELEKSPHFHEMPVIYTVRLCEKWLATLFEGKEYVPSRDGQSGGVPVFEVEGLPDELYQF
jgi:hypothetical protein